MTTRQQDCLQQMRDIYEQFTGEEVAYAISVIRAERTQQECRHQLQIEILEKQKKLDGLENNKIT